MGRAAAAVAAELIVVWEPQSGPQTALITCPVFEVVYGGARGGGKTDGMLGDWISHSDIYGRHAKGLMVRRTRVQLVDTIERAKELFLPLGATWKDQDKAFVMPNGAVLRMAYVERDKDAEAYQGHSYTRVYVEELTNFPDPKPVMKLKATLRSPHGVKVGFRATCNPGGPGHLWVKARYIDPAPQGFKVLREVEEINGVSLTVERVFIPAKLQDNPALMASDPMYPLRVKQAAGSVELARAWLDGDWNVVLGAFFDAWSPERHIVRPFEIPGWWARLRGMDWGSARPFSVGWYAVSDGYETPSGVWLPPGCLVKYREWYGAQQDDQGETIPNEGLKLFAEPVADGIKKRQPRWERYQRSVADPSAFSQDGGPSIAERMHRRGVTWSRADNARVAREGHLGGWDQMRARLEGEDGHAMLVFFEGCKDSIRTIPALQHDELRPEDVDTEGEDHAADETRYVCMARPYTRPIPKAKQRMRGPEEATLNELLRLQDQGKGERYERI